MNKAQTVCQECGSANCKCGFERGSSSQRGYDSAWRKLRAWKINESPLCEICLRYNRTRIACDVDHIEPFKGKDDPLRLDSRNTQSLCRACHNKKTRNGNK